MFTASNSASSLIHLFNPGHVAVIGASRTPGKNGYRVSSNLLRWGFGGEISLINPSGGDIEGVPCYKSLADVFRPIDCAIIVIPADDALDAVRECAAKGAKAIVVSAVGFAETGTEEGRRRQAELTSIARVNGIRILGPNTNGFLNAADRLSLGYNTSHGEPMPAGKISVVSHSGALMNHFIRRLNDHGVGLSKFVPVGNEADINMLDILEYYIEDKDTAVIGMIIEGISDGVRFRTLAERARTAGKQILALKLGRSQAGAESSLAHSSRLAGNARAYAAMFRSCGIASVPTVEALAGGCALLVERPIKARTDDHGLICLSNSGAGATLLADFADDYGIPLAAFDKASPSSIISEIRNPMDTGGIGGVKRLAEIFSALAMDNISGPVVALVHTVLTPGSVEALTDAVLARKKQASSPTVILSPGGLGEEIEGIYRKNGIPIFRDTTTFYDSLHCYYVALSQVAGANLSVVRTHLAKGGDKIRKVLIAAKGKEFLSEVDSADVLRCIAIPIVDNHDVGSADDAVKVADKLGYPVVLKALAPDVAHKNKLGFVVVNLRDRDTVRREFEALRARVAANGYNAAKVPLILQPMLPHKAEIIVGVSRDAALGHFLVVGLGGIYTEVLDQVTLIPVSANATTIRDWIAISRLGQLIASMEKQEGRILEQLVAILDGLRCLILDHGDLIESVDINPVLVTDQGCVAVDALIVPRA